VADPTPEELERFFFLNAAALEVARTKRRRHNRLGWVVQWGTVRMLGTFLEDPVDVPRVVVDYAAGQLGIDDPSCIKQYAERVPTRCEHAWEIRDLLEFRDFTDVQEEVAAFVASRVATTRDSRRELFDRAVLWLIEQRVLLPDLLRRGFVQSPAAPLLGDAVPVAAAHLAGAVGHRGGHDRDVRGERRGAPSHALSSGHDSAKMARGPQ
jgi:hypothetical protein